MQQRVKIFPKNGVHFQVQADGSVHWSLADRHPQAAREVIYHDYYTKDPATGQVTSQHEEAHLRIGPFYPEEDPNRRDLEVFHLHQVAEVPAPHAEHGLALKVKMVSP